MGLNKEKEGRSRPELEINLASALLATITAKDLDALIRRAQEAGFPNFCVLPFRGLKEGGAENLARKGVSVVHIEDAWNPLSGKLYDYLIPALVAGTYGTFSRKILGRESEIPLLEDSLFPSKETSQRIVQELMEAFLGAKFISHQASLGKIPPDRFLLEINRGVGMGEKEIIEWAEKTGVYLVFDPSHLLRRVTAISVPNQPTRPKNDWESEFDFFARTGRLEVVDIRPSFKSRGSYQQSNERNKLQELAAAAKEVSSIRYLRLETGLPIADQLPVISREKDFLALRKIAQALREA